MRKSLLLTLEFPPQKGGTQRYYFNICRNLPSDKIVILTLKPPNPPLERGENLDTPQREFDKGGLTGNEIKVYRGNLLVRYLYPHWLPMVLHLRKTVKKEKIELIQVGQVLPCGTAAFLINKFFKIPYIVYTHGLDILGPQKNSRKKKLMIKILSNAEKVVSNSEFTKNEVVKLGIERGKVFVVYPGVKTPQPPFGKGGKIQIPPSPPLGKGGDLDPVLSKIEELKKKYNLSDKKILLSVCRLVERKGIDSVISALGKFKEELKDVVYVVVGDGPKMEDLKKLCISHFKSPQPASPIESRTGFAKGGTIKSPHPSASESGQLPAGYPKIVFTGRVSDEELDLWYRMCDVFILIPKKSDFDVEGFGIVYAEASSYSKPVIGSDFAGTREAVENGVTGILVEPENVEQIGKAIVELFNDEDLRERLGRQGRERVEREFGIEGQMERVREVIE